MQYDVIVSSRQYLMIANAKTFSIGDQFHLLFVRAIQSHPRKGFDQVPRTSHRFQLPNFNWSTDNKIPRDRLHHVTEVSPRFNRIKNVPLHRQVVRASVRARHQAHLSTYMELYINNISSQ